MYILNYLDRQNIAAAKLANIMEDLDLSITEYNSVVSVLFAGYSEFFYPPSILANHADNSSSDAGPFEPHRLKDQVASNLYLHSCGCLGACFRLHCSCS